MATITFTVASATVNGSKAYTLTDAEIGRFIAAYKARIGPGATNAQALLGWAAESMAAAKANTLSYEAAELAKTATPLNPV